MNLLPCDVNVKIFNNSGYDNNFKIAAKMNEIITDLEVGKYTFEVNTNEDCSGNLSGFFSWNQLFVYILHNLFTFYHLSCLFTLFSAVSGTASILNGKVASYELETKSETVTGILVRTFENNLNVMAMEEDEKPGKSTDPKIK